MPAQTRIATYLNRGGWFATPLILGSGGGFVNPDFSTSPVQAVLMGFLYQGTGTSLSAHSSQHDAKRRLAAQNAENAL